MTKEACKKFLRSKGYLLTYWEGYPPFKGQFVADGVSWGGYHTAPSLNALCKQVKNYLKTHPIK